MSSDIPTLNLSESNDGMVPLDMHTRSTTFVPEETEKNVHNYKDDMDSTPISDVIGQPQETSFEPPLMGVDPRAVQMAQQQVMMPMPSQQQGLVPKKEPEQKKKKNPFDLTDEQLNALIVVFATGLAVSKPIQEKLATTVPRFLNAQGNRSLVGLASTGAVAGITFFIARKYF